MKAFLAGKRGICPDCDAKFIVPAVSGALAVSVDPGAEMSSTESASVEAPKVSVPVESPAEPAASRAPVPQIDQHRVEPSFTPAPSKPRARSRRERARRVSVVLGTLVLLLAVALVLVLWSQSW